MSMHSASSSFFLFTLVLIFGILVACCYYVEASNPEEYFGNGNVKSKQFYLDWLNKNKSYNYTKSVFLPAAAGGSTTNNNDPLENGVAIHWSINESKNIINFAVAVRASGWVGIGIAEAGGMSGSDVALFQISDPSRIIDSYVLDDRIMPTEDENCQNWILKNYWLLSSSSSDDDGDDDEFLIFEGERQLNTNDPQDRPIINDGDLQIPPHRVIAAWGNTKTVSYHGSSNRARGAIRFFPPMMASTTTPSFGGTTTYDDEQEKTTTSTTSSSAAKINDDETEEVEIFESLIKTNAEGSFTVKAQDHPIVWENRTEYAYFCFNRNYLVSEQNVPSNKDLHIIGFEPLLDPNTIQYVHHFIMYVSTKPYRNLLYSCDTAGSSTADEDFNEIAYSWAPGQGPMIMPDNVGAPFMSTHGFKSFMLEIHYDNPNHDVGLLDNSGVRFYYTSKIREHDFGILQLGDPNIELWGNPVGDGLTAHSFTCNSGCMNSVLNNRHRQPATITVLSEHLHMHQTGRRMVNEHIRNGMVIREGCIDFWDFEQQGAAAVIQQPFQVLPGDTFRTTCYYESSSNNSNDDNNGEGEVFGAGSDDEMCMAFMFYYPRIIVMDTFAVQCSYDLGWEPCESQYEMTPLADISDLRRIFGTQSKNVVCPAEEIDHNIESQVTTKTTTTTNNLVPSGQQGGNDNISNDSSTNDDSSSSSSSSSVAAITAPKDEKQQQQQSIKLSADNSNENNILSSSPALFHVPSIAFTVLLATLLTTTTMMVIEVSELLPCLF